MVNEGSRSVAGSYDGETLILSAPIGFDIEITSGCSANPGPASVISCAVRAMRVLSTVTFTVVVASSDSPPETVAYAAGWNLIGVPFGTMVAGLDGPLYTYRAGDAGYEPVKSESALQPGTGYWAYFDLSTVVELPDVGPLSANVALPAGQYVLIGNPGQAPIEVFGADIIYIYDPTVGQYSPSLFLQSGQGGWAYSASGGTARVFSGLP